MTNPTVHIGLRQLPKLVNALIARHGRPDRIATAAARAEATEVARKFADRKQPWEGFRDELDARLARTVVSHKPDPGCSGKPSRHRDVTAGKLHDDQPCGLTGPAGKDGIMPIVVKRIPFSRLKPADISDPDGIRDATLRDALWIAIRDCMGKDFDRALSRFANEHPVFGGIRRVRFRSALTVIPIHDRRGTAYRAVKGNGNQRIDIWRRPDGKWQADVVSVFDAHQVQTQDRRPHPAAKKSAKKALGLRQGDILAVERNGGPVELLVVRNFSQSGRLMLAGVNESGNLDARHAATVDPFRSTFLSPGSLQKAKARQIRIDPLGRVFDPGPREQGAGMDRIVGIAADGLHLSRPIVGSFWSKRTGQRSAG